MLQVGGAVSPEAFVEGGGEVHVGDGPFVGSALAGEDGEGGGVGGEGTLDVAGTVSGGPVEPGVTEVDLVGGPFDGFGFAREGR
jgi:hypothetical protein